MGKRIQRDTTQYSGKTSVVRVKRHTVKGSKPPGQQPKNI